MEPDFQRILQGFPGQVLVLAADGPRFTILAASDTYLRATLTERTEIIDKGVFEVFPDDPDDPETKAVDVARTSFQRVVDERRADAMGIRRHDVRRPEAEGGGFEERYWQPLNSPILGDDGQVVCIVHQVEDVTDAVLHGQKSDALRAANVALRESSAALAREFSGHETTAQDLERSRFLLASSLEAQKDTVLFSIDHAYKYLSFNKAHVETMKRAYGADIEPGACVLDCITDAEDRAAAKENYDRALAGESHTNVRVYGDVERACYESFFNPVLDESGEIIGATGLARDVTERMLAEEQLAQMTRLYATLSQVNQTIVRVKEPEELYQSICDVAVEFGGFTLAWVGLLDEASGDVRPVTASGLDVAHWPFEIVNIRHGVSKNGLVATAIRSQEIATSEDVESDERMRDVLGQIEGRGYHSIAAIPLALGGETVGVLVLASQRSGLFEEASEVGLLEEIGQHISFALDAMATEAEREHAAEELVAHATRLEIMADASATFAEVAQDFEAVLDGIARLMSEVLADICQVRLLSEDGERLELIALHALEPGASETLRALEPQLRLADDSPSMWRVVQSGEPLFAPVIAGDEVRASVSPDVWPAYEPFAPHSYIVVPLRAQGHVTGLLSLSRISSQRRAFTKDDLDLAQDLADRAALAISNASLLRQIQRELAERTRAEKRLRESQAQLQAALASMTDAVFISDAQGNFIEFNDAFAAFHRFPSKAECAVTLVEYPEFLEVFMADGGAAPLAQWAVPRALRGETGANVEYGLRRKDTGETWTGSYSFAPIRDAAGEIVGSVVVGRDVTEQKAAEATLRESEQNFRTLAEAVPQIVWITQPDGKNIYFNQHWVDYTGLTLEESYGDGWKAPFHPEDRQRASDAWQRATTEDAAYSLECRLRGADGTYRWWLIRGAPLRDANGVILKWFGTCTDIEEIKRSEAALRESEERYRQLFEGESDAVLLVDNESGRILEANGAASTMYGYSHDEILGLSDLDLSADPDRLLADTRGATAGRSVVGAPVRAHRREDGSEFPVEITGGFFTLEDRVVRIAAVRDVTARRQAEEEVQRLNAELEERVRSRTAQLEAANKELEAFAYSVSHDLRAPLRHISGYAGILKADSQDALDDDGRACLDTITDAAREMGVLIDNLLQFSRIGRAEMQIGDVDMAVVLEEALAPIRDEAQGRAVEWSIGALPHVTGDPALLRQVWANLLGNAVKYSRDRDPARIEVGVVDGDAPLASGASSEHVFFVRDNGVGFDMQYAHKLFGVFQRLHSSAQFEGTGIGLATVDRIITRHGGRVWAEATVDEGATFSFALPGREGAS